MAITVWDLARFRGVEENHHGQISMAEFERVGLSMIGGCEICAATVAAGNAAPSKTGFLRCANGCISDQGFDTVEAANIALFPEEYEWTGVPARNPRQSAEATRLV